MKSSVIKSYIIVLPHLLWIFYYHPTNMVLNTHKDIISWSSLFFSSNSDINIWYMRILNKGKKKNDGLFSSDRSSLRYNAPLPIQGSHLLPFHSAHGNSIHHSSHSGSTESISYSSCNWTLVTQSNSRNLMQITQLASPRPKTSLSYLSWFLLFVT